MSHFLHWNSHAIVIWHAIDWHTQLPRLFHWAWYTQMPRLLHCNWHTQMPHLLHWAWHTQTPCLLHWDWHIQATPPSLELGVCVRACDLAMDWQSLFSGCSESIVTVRGDDWWMNEWMNKYYYIIRSDESLDNILIWSFNTASFLLTVQFSTPCVCVWV